MSSACEEIRLLLPDALTGRLSPAHAAEVDGHLTACAGCRAHRDRLARAAKALDEAFPKASPARRHVWARVERSVRERAEARGVSAPVSSELPAAGRRRLLWATAVAAALVCAIVLFSRFSRGLAEPTREIARTPAVLPHDVIPEAEPSPPASGLAARRDPTAPALPPETSQLPAPPVTPAPEIAEAEPEDLEIPDFERGSGEGGGAAG
jgi:anti-sigma factor RsiW